MAVCISAGPWKLRDHHGDWHQAWLCSKEQGGHQSHQWQGGVFFWKYARRIWRYFWVPLKSLLEFYWFLGEITTLSGLTCQSCRLTRSVLVVGCTALGWIGKLRIKECAPCDNLSRLDIMVLETFSFQSFLKDWFRAEIYDSGEQQFERARPNWFCMFYLYWKFCGGQSRLKEARNMTMNSSFSA